LQKKDLFDSLVVVKRSGQRCDFQGEKIAVAIKKAFDSLEHSYENKDINAVYSAVLNKISKNYENRKTIKIEDIQDIILEVLQEKNYQDIYFHYKKYREQRAHSRESFTTKEQHKFLKSLEKLGLNNSEDPKLVGSSLPPYVMFHDFGKVISAEFAQSFLLDHKTVRNLDSGLLYLHGLEYYPMGNPASVQLLYSKFIPDSESKHVFGTLMQLSRLIRQIFLEQYGNVMIPYFDLELERSVIGQFKEIWKNTLHLKLSSFGLQSILPMTQFSEVLEQMTTLDIDLEQFEFFYQDSKPLKTLFWDSYQESLTSLREVLSSAMTWFLEELDFSYQQNLKHQKVSFSFGTTPTTASYLIGSVLIQVLISLKSEAVLGIFKLKKELHFDPNSSLFSLYQESEEAYLMGVLDYEMLDVDYNLGHEVCYGAFGERAFFDNTTQDAVLVGEKGSVSFTTINLPRIALRHRHDENLEGFYEELKETLELAKSEILERFEYQCGKHNYNFPCLISEGVWKFGEMVKESDRLRKVWKHGVLQVNFVGLWETIWLLLEKKEQEVEAQQEAMKILKLMRNILDRYSEENNLNFTLCALDLDDVGTYFYEMDEVIYGKIKSYQSGCYANSFHISSKMNLENRMAIEGAFHALCNGGHVFLLNGVSKPKLLSILKRMIELGIGYTHYQI